MWSVDDPIIGKGEQVSNRAAIPEMGSRLFFQIFPTVGRFITNRQDVHVD
jgi:hypothetical protein